MKKDREKVNSKKGLGSKGSVLKQQGENEGGSCNVDSDCGVGQECIGGVCKAKNTTGPIVNPPIPPQ